MDAVLSYHLVRKVMAQAALAAQAHGRKRRRRPGQAESAHQWTPRQFSFSCAVEQVMSWWHENTTGAADQQAGRYEVLLAGVSRRRVGQRPGRCEPRAVKRRPKEYDRLMEPRAVAQARLRGELPPRDAKKQAKSASKPDQPKSGAARRPKGKAAAAQANSGAAVNERDDLT